VLVWPAFFSAGLFSVKEKDEASPITFLLGRRMPSFPVLPEHEGIFRFHASALVSQVFNRAAAQTTATLKTKNHAEVSYAIPGGWIVRNHNR
jgi:hypothetical protein